MPKHYLVIAGDPSGDRHAADLVKAMRQKSLELEFTTMGGPYLRDVADAFLYPLVGVGGFGFWEPLFKLPQLWKANRLARNVLDKKPAALILVDFYGFNIHIARAAKARDVPVFYYVSPQVWASRAHRVRELAEVVTKMLVIFPFEEALYKQAGVPATYVGHPLIERLPAPENPSAAPTLGLLPGSRRSVVAKHLPILVETAKRLKDKMPELQVTLFRPRHLEIACYADALRDAPWIQLEEDADYRIRRQLWLSIGVSGTAALENMLLGIPMIIMYRLSWLTYRIAKRLVLVPYIGIPNLMAGKEICPELLQEHANPEALAEAAYPLLMSAEKRQTMRGALLTLREKLHAGGSAKAAEIILNS